MPSPPEEQDGILRPDFSILDEQSLVPAENLIQPAPNYYTHRLKRPEPYFYGNKDDAITPDGEFPADTKVVLVQRNGDRCRVADGQGLYVEIDGSNLETLPSKGKG